MANTRIYTYYLFRGSNEDFLNLGGPHPNIPVEDAYQHAFNKYLKTSQYKPGEGSKIRAEDPFMALEKVKKIYRSLYIRRFNPVVVLIANKEKLLCSYQVGFSKGYKPITIKGQVIYSK